MEELWVVVASQPEFYFGQVLVLGSSDTVFSGSKAQCRQERVRLESEAKRALGGRTLGDSCTTERHYFIRRSRTQPQ